LKYATSHFAIPEAFGLMDRRIPARDIRGRDMISAADDLSDGLGPAHISSRFGVIPDHARRPEFLPIDPSLLPHCRPRSRPLTAFGENIKLISTG
jgi:hypothetical protein